MAVNNKPNAPKTFLFAEEARRLTDCSTIIWTEIIEIQKIILNNLDQCADNCVTIGDATPITAFNGIDSVTINNGGTGYFSVEPTVTIDHPSGTGADLTPIVSSGIIQGFTVSAGGSGYDPVEVTADMSGSGNADATLNPIINTDGGIEVVNVINGGTGYSVGDNIPFVHPNGSGAQAEVADVDGNGAIISTLVTNKGENYEPVVATATINHPVGTGFEGTVMVSSGSVTGITVADGGQGYNTLKPKITIDGSGVGAAFTITVDSGTGEITNVTIDNKGSGYESSDTVTVEPALSTSGSDADLELVIESPDSTIPVINGLNPIDYYQAWINQDKTSILYENILEIKRYFESLNYFIEVLENPASKNTLQWRICW